jgi:hypothetical protein
MKLADSKLRILINSFELCTPLIAYCKNYSPTSGKMRFFLNVDIINSGINAVMSTVSILFNTSNSNHIFFLDESEKEKSSKNMTYRNFTSGRISLEKNSRRNLQDSSY